MPKFVNRGAVNRRAGGEAVNVHGSSLWPGPWTLTSYMEVNVHATLDSRRPWALTASGPGAGTNFGH